MLCAVLRLLWAIHFEENHVEKVHLADGRGCFSCR